MSAVRIVDVGPRDGLQNASVTLAPSVRADLCARIARAGVTRIEAVSFVHPGRVPQMAGAEDVAARLSPADRARCSGLVLNERGFERLLASGLPEVRYAFAASDAFNRRNQNASTAEGLEIARRVVASAKARGLRVGVTIATAFGCPFEGEVDPGAVAALAAELAQVEPDEIVLADTIGVAAPGQVRWLCEACAPLGPTLGAHFHNTRNTGYANAVAALEAGAELLDASIGGLGGCPFAPGATGNVATEDLVYMLERDGVATGVDLDALIDASRWLERASGLTLDGQLRRVEPFPPRAPAGAGAEPLSR